MVSEFVDILVLGRSQGGELTDEMQRFVKVLAGADDCILGFTMIGSAAGEAMAAMQTAMPAGLPYPRLRERSSRICYG